jgi:hypothetical protein
VTPDATTRGDLPREARSGLLPWGRDELPAPPLARGRALFAVLGPGVIVLGAAIGSGEWLIGPVAIVRYGLTLLWVTTVAVFLQTVFNGELMRYTLYTGEPGLATVVALMSVWILFKTQLDIFEGSVRSLTDILWSASVRVRSWRGGDVRFLYHAILVVLVLWGVFALSLTQPLVLLQIGANMAGVVMVLAPLHILRVNMTLLPEPIRPPLWRRVALVFMAFFYGTFVWLWLMGGLVPDPRRGFVFQVGRALGL